MNSAKRFFGAFYRRRILWSFSAGVVYSLAFFDGALFVFGLLGLFMLFLRLFTAGEEDFVPEKPFVTVLWFGFGFFIPLYSWLTALYPFSAFGLTRAQGIFVVICGVFGIGAFHALLLALPFLLMRLVPRRTALYPLAAACCYMAGEWLMSLGTLAFPWGMTAVGQYRFLPLLQNASLLGAYFITFIVCFFTSSLSLAARRKRRPFVIMTCVSLLVPLLAGTVILIVPQNSSGVIRVAAVQGNEPMDEKWDTAKLNENIDKYISLTRQAAEDGAKLIVLPETAFPCEYTSSIHRRVADIAAEYGCTVLVGAMTRTSEGYYNSVFAVYPDGSRSEKYDKRRLVPFGEFLPWRDLLVKILPFLDSVNLSSLNLSPGESDPQITAYGARLGCLICFDSVFAPLARGEYDLICVCTNDSWFKDTPGIYQHAAHSAVRAAETGKWIVRAANTGVSCFISPEGAVYDPTEPLTEALIVRDITFSQSRTLYSRVGDVILLLPLCFFIFCVAHVAADKIKKSRNKERETL